MLTQIILISIIPILYLAEYRIRRRDTSVSFSIGKYEYIIALAVACALSISFAYFTGILSSGFHLVDDYEALAIEDNIDAFGLWGALKMRLSADLYGRFRPTYCIIRVFQTYIFRSDYQAWHMMYAIITALILYMAYIYARTRGAHMWMAYVAAVAVFIGGGQSSVMWRLGPQEGLGLLLFMTALMCLMWYRRNRSVVSLIILTILTILLSGSKEAFLVLLPCLPAMLVIWDVEEQDHASFRTIVQAIGHNIVYICITVTICVADILFIMFGINTEYIDDQYLGEAAASFGLYDYIRGIGASVLRGFLPYFIIALAANILFIILICRHRRDAGKSYLIRHILILLLADVMVAVQIIMYSKYHMNERYIIPSSMFVAALWYIGAFRLIAQEQDGKTGRIYMILSVVFAIVLFLIRYDTVAVQYLYPGATDQAMALSYAADGRDITAALDYLGETAGGGDVCISMYGEHAASASSYLKHFYDMGDRIRVSEPDDTVFSDEMAYLVYTADVMAITDDQGVAVDGSRIHKYGEYTVIAR